MSHRFSTRFAAAGQSMSPHRLFFERLESRQMLSGTQTFTNADPVAPLSTTPPPSGMSNLDASDFTFLGAQSLGQYDYFTGLAYRPETNTFFSILGGGQAPFDLVEFSNTGPGGGFNLVKNWGNLDPNNQLLPGATSPAMEGLWWDDANQRLWVSFGDYYNASQANDQVMAYVTLDTGTPVVHGPWGVVASVGSEQVKSEITPAPPELAAITGNKWMMSGGKSNAGQALSWGAGLVSVADPSSLPADSLTSAEQLVNWPMKTGYYENGAVYAPYSDFPSGNNVTYIVGNENANPPTTLSYEYNTLINQGAHFVEGDGLSNYTFIDTGNVEGFIYIGLTGNGYTWYGNYNGHNDTSATGVQYGNNMTSLLNPGQPLVDQVQSRGSHAEQFDLNAYFVNYQDVLNAATAVKNGTATAATLQVAPSSIVSLATLGGAAPVSETFPVIGSYFDPITDNLYLLQFTLTSSQLLIWHVAAPSTPLTIPAAPSGEIATAANGQISLSWAAVADAAYYTVYRGTASGGESGTPLITGLTSTSLGDVAVSSGTTYYYQVAADNAAGQSVLSEEVFASLESPAPNGLSATVGNGKVSLTWTPIAGATSYNVYRGTVSGGEARLATGVAADSFTDTAASNLQTYYYQVTAVESAAESAKSAEIAVTPMTPHERYVEAVYNDVLGRAADLSGLVAWAYELDVGIPVSSVAMSIAHSLEYYARFVIEPAFEELLGRPGDAAAVNSLAAQMQAGLTDQQLEGLLLASTEFRTDAGGTTAGWVSKVYQTLFDRAPDSSGLAFWEEALSEGETYSQVAQAIAASRENNTQLIEADYSHYLGRAADPAGLAAWLQQLAAGRANEDIIAGFTGSQEYYNEHTS